jgi:hypothetical protein
MRCSSSLLVVRYLHRGSNGGSNKCDGSPIESLIASRCVHSKRGWINQRPIELDTANLRICVG